MAPVGGRGKNMGVGVATVGAGGPKALAVRKADMPYHLQCAPAKSMAVPMKRERDAKGTRKGLPAERSGHVVHSLCTQRRAVAYLDCRAWRQLLTPSSTLRSLPECPPPSRPFRLAPLPPRWGGRWAGEAAHTHGQAGPAGHASVNPGPRPRDRHVA